MRINEIKKAILYNLKAKCKGSSYTVIAGRLYKKDGKLNYAIELLDKNQNSVIYANLKDVELVKEE